MNGPTQEEIRTLLVDADSALSLIYHRAGSLIESRFGHEYKEGLSDLYWRCRKMAESLKGKDNTMLPELPVACAIGDHIPAIVHRCGGPSAELHNTCGKCGRMILNLAGTWILDVCREDTPSEGDLSRA